MVATARVLGWIGLVMLLVIDPERGPLAIKVAPRLPRNRRRCPAARSATPAMPISGGRSAAARTSRPRCRTTSGGLLIQSEGDNWRAIRNGPLSTYGAWALLGIVALLALFFLIRGRIRIEHGWSGRTITRFNFVDRFAHWLTATCFVVLALTGLNMLYGRYALRPLIGPELFSMLMLGGKYAHNFLAFGFMLGLVLMIVLWIWHNFPNRYDFVWLAKGGGMFTKGTHPPAKKFNAGQKLVFWLVVLGGISVSLSGLMLMFPLAVRGVRPHLRLDQLGVRHRLSDRAGADPGDAAGAALARHHGAVPDRGDHRPHLHRHDRHGGCLRRHGQWRGRRELGARAPQHLGAGPGA